VIAGSTENAAAAEATYKRLAANANELLADSAEYYRKYLDDTVKLELPDTKIQQAYDWARISAAQGIVANPFLGTGLVAGYRTSGNGQRPGFAWYFGRDAMWTSLALDSEGDFATTRTALEFLSKYQRSDGKMPHEVSQGATFVPWFTGYEFPYASADATPLFLIAMNDYVTQSGDIDFAKEKWDNIFRANRFLRSTLDSQGLAQNQGVGHGWVEGGPLLPVKAEIYQSGLGLEASRAADNLARLVGKSDGMDEPATAFAQQKARLNEAYWAPEANTYAYALGRDGKQIPLPSVLATVPMWFDLLDSEKAGKMLEQLADEDQETDWGMRIISSRWPQYSGGGYHYGSVWPLFTGWAAVAEYRYHRAFPAYANLRANALLALDGSLGHVTEVLSGDEYQALSGSSPHQIWSAAMVISPLLRGLLGLSANAEDHTLVFAPHVPADWDSFAIKNVRVGPDVIDLSYRRSKDEITLEAKKTGADECFLEFRPAVSMRATVDGVEINGRAAKFHMEASDVDQHVEVRIPLAGGANTARIRLHDDFGLSYEPELPPLGSTSRGLRIISESWSQRRDSLTLRIAGAAGAAYELGVRDAGQVASVEGAELKKGEGGTARLRLTMPLNGSDAYVHAQVTLRFVGRRGEGKSGR
jgi:Amylo-alpha-1,6-glucosidase